MDVLLYLGFKTFDINIQCLDVLLEAGHFFHIFTSLCCPVTFHVNSVFGDGQFCGLNLFGQLFQTQNLCPDLAVMFKVFRVLSVYVLAPKSLMTLAAPGKVSYFGLSLVLSL